VDANLLASKLAQIRSPLPPDNSSSDEEKPSDDEDNFELSQHSGSLPSSTNLATPLANQPQSSDLKCPAT